MSTLIEALQKIADAEQNLAKVAQHLLVLHQYGALQKQDIRTYDVLRAQLYGTQLATYAQVVVAVQAAPGGSHLVGQIPIPQIAPAFPVNANLIPTGGSTSTPAPTMHGLGNPIVVVIGGVSIAIPVWAVIILVIAVLVAIVAVYVATVQVFTASEQIDANTQSVEDYYATQERLLRTCISSGRSPADCANLVAHVQPPSVARPADPMSPGGTPPGGDLSQWAKWLALGAAAVVGTLAFVYIAPKMLGAGRDSRSSSSGGRRYALVEEGS